MAAMRISERAWWKPSLRRGPTTLDVSSSEALLRAMRTHFLSLTVPKRPGINQKDGSAWEDHTKMEEQLGKQNVWVPTM